MKPPISSADPGSAMMPRGVALAVALLGFGLPCACLVAITVLRPGADAAPFGIRGSVWCLFACSPLTALCLHGCNRLIARAGRRGGSR